MYTVLKGTHDIILDEANKYSYVEEVLTYVASTYNFKEFRTPIIESSDLFIRAVGDGSDIVRKEMYTFLDKGNRQITLRPEMTASVIRSMVNAKVFAMQDFPVKAYYLGPNFRYERPQQGRFRQFNQFGVESCGVNSFYRDVEVISLGYNALKVLGFDNLKLKINSLGDEETRANYRNALKEFFACHLDEMCEDCKERYEKNILRILDCKVPEDQEIVKKAPKLSDFYTESAKQYFENILNELNKLGIEYEVDETLVRGLDYYSGVVFEYHYTSKLNKNYGALGAGGHYNNLIKEIGGPDLEGVGLAFGIERLVSVMNDDDLFDELNDKLDLYVMPLGNEAVDEAYSLTNFLRMNGYSSEICLESKNISQMFKKAERRKACYALIIGEDEIKNDKIVIKNLSSKEQFEVSNDELIDKLDEIFGEEECECGCDHHHE